MRWKSITTDSIKHVSNALVFECQGAGDGDGFRQVDEADDDGEAEGLLHGADEGEEQIAGVAGQATGDGTHVVDPVGSRIARHIELPDVHDGDGQDGHREGTQSAQEKETPASAQILCGYTCLFDLFCSS